MRKGLTEIMLNIHISTDKRGVMKFYDHLVGSCVSAEVRNVECTGDIPESKREAYPRR